LRRHAPAAEAAEQLTIRWPTPTSCSAPSYRPCVVGIGEVNLCSFPIQAARKLFLNPRKIFMGRFHSK
jgi:hypothetical protein